MGSQEAEDRDAIEPKGHSCPREPGYKMAWRERLGVSDPVLSHGLWQAGVSTWGAVSAIEVGSKSSSFEVPRV